MSRVVVLGDVMVDVIARLSGPLAPGSDSPAVVHFQGGGSAANTAAWIAATGGQPVLAGRVGDDDSGRAARDDLGALGVRVRLAVDPELPTGACIVLVAPDGERTMAPDAGANRALAPEDLPDDVFAPEGHLHVVGYALLRPGSRPAARAAMARAREAGMSVSVDPSSSALLSGAFLDDCGDAQLLLPNASEAHALTGESAPERAARTLAGRVGEVVVKLGREGALWTNGEEVLRAAAVPVESAIDSTGAGDAFAAGLLHARTSGASTAESLAAACKLAAQAVATPGARP